MNYIPSAFHCLDTDEESADGWARLKTAVSGMAVASEVQKDSVRDFQTSMKDLRTSVDRLGRTCEKYLHRLGRIRIRRLRHHSLALVKTMEESLGPRAVGEQGVVNCPGAGFLN